MLDAQIGQAVERFRKNAELTQSALARAMSERGWKWNQNIVAKVESGGRPLRLAEANDLATILNTQAFMFTTAWSDQAAENAKIVALYQRSVEEEDKLAHAIAEWAAQNISLKSLLLHPSARWRLLEEEFAGLYLAQAAKDEHDLARRASALKQEYERHQSALFNQNTTTNQEITELLQRILNEWKAVLDDGVDSEEG